MGAPYIDAIDPNPHLQAALKGITAAVVGVIGTLAFMFAQHVLFPNMTIDIFAFVSVVVSFILLQRYHLSVPLLVLAGSFSGVILFITR